MRPVFSLMRRDLRHLRGNVIALVVLVGIVVVPTFYAWFNIAGSWDPYASTKNLKVAVANTDEGYTSALMPVNINAGERVVSDLRASKSIGYVVTSKDDALEGVRSGEYYAAIVIPEDFTRNMMTVLTTDPVKPSVDFYQNEKANAIAQIVTNKASTAVQADIDASFAQTVTTVGTGLMEEMGGLLDDDKFLGFATQLETAVNRSADTLTSTAADMRDYADLVAAAEGLLDGGSTGIEGSLESTIDVGDTLRTTASGVRSAGDAINGTTSSINDALQKGQGALDNVQGSIDDAFQTAGEQVDLLSGALTDASDAVDRQVEALDAISGRLQDLSDRLGDAMRLFESDSRAYTILRDLQDSVDEFNGRVEDSADDLRELSSQLTKTSDDLIQGKTDAESAQRELQGLIADAKSNLTAVKGFYESRVQGSLGDLAGTIDDAAGDADTIRASLKSTLGSVDSTAADAARTLSTARRGLDSAASKLERSARTLTGLHAKLETALSSGDLAQVKAVLSASPDDLAAFISAPVTVDRTAIFPIENNGSAMTPFYTTLAIWIGGVVLAALLKANPSEAALEECGCGHTAGYVGRLALFAGIGFLQSSLICAGDLFFLGAQCENVPLLFLACWAASFTFVNIIYALTASFGDVGKAVAVVLMVIQVAGSGGTFPREMLPSAFQAVYPFLPFVWSENAMRAAMFGIYNGDYWMHLGKLLAFVLPSLLLGLVLRVPVIRLNEWVEHKLESTKVM